MTFNIFNAINTLNLNKEQPNSIFNINKFNDIYKRNVTMGEIGCTLSHISLYKKIFNDNNIGNDDFVLVSEDDILFSEHFWDVLSKLEKQTINADLLVLGESKVSSFSCKKIEIKAPLSLRPLNKKVEYRNFVYGYPSHYYYAGTVCYLIKKSAIAKFPIHNNNTLPYWLADDFSLFYKEFGIKTKMLRPIIAIENPILESNLENNRSIISPRPKKYRRKIMFLLKYPFKKIIAIIINILR
ncbi:glycosyltransferase family 25 protein [Canicola haemoglobinophilus]|nr:glycosyltransferase family 25 protein [Canicola haemoglobinophilus]